jgi:hypothetical protein
MQLVDDDQFEEAKLLAKEVLNFLEWSGKEWSICLASLAPSSSSMMMSTYRLEGPRLSPEETQELADAYAELIEESMNGQE